MLLAAGREVVSKTSAYNITKLSYRVREHTLGKWKGKISTFQTRIRRLNYEEHAVAEAENKMERDNK